MPIKSLDHFSFLAPFYDHVIHLESVEKIIASADLPTSGMLLDVGGGTGRVSEALQGMASSRVIADLSLGMLRQASAKDGLRTVCSHSEKLPFADETFERIIMVDALHHVCDQEETAQELWRVLKSGGRIVLEEPDIRIFSIKMVALFEKLALMRSHFLPPSKIKDLFHSPNARSHIEQDGHNARVIVQKVKS
jgi:ubiquinone/menaquinone biosynthesis C-methylase UbiE